MIAWENLKKAKLGQTFNIRESECCCRAIYGGMSWPGQRPGGAVVVAMNHALPTSKNEVCLLDEVEILSLRDLVRQGGILDFKYRPKRWICDWQYDPAIPFIREMNENRSQREHRSFEFAEPFELLEMKPLYPYILDEIKRLLVQDRRQLFLPDDSKIQSYLSGIEPEEIPKLELGAYPLIEALAFAVIEVLREEKEVRVPKLKHNPYDDYTLTRGLPIHEKLVNRRKKRLF